MPKPFKLMPSEDDKFYFVLRSGSNVLLTSETYETHANAKKGIEAVIRAAKKWTKLKGDLYLMIEDKTINKKTGRGYGVETD